MKKIKDTIIIIFLSCVVGGVISGAVYLTSNIYKESQANRIIIQERIYEEGKKAGMLRLHPSPKFGLMGMWREWNFQYRNQNQRNHNVQMENRR